MRLGKTIHNYSTTTPKTVSSIASLTLPVDADTYIVNANATIAILSGGVDGQPVTIMPGTGYSVFVASGILVIGGDASLSAGQHITLQKWDGVWYGTSRLGQQGFQGNQGDSGPAGPQGSQGAIGDIGSQGLQGPQGNLGSQGAIGSTGPVGFDGPPGNQGAQGAIGPDGNQGPQGDPCIP